MIVPKLSMMSTFTDLHKPDDKEGNKETRSVTQPATTLASSPFLPPSYCKSSQVWQVALCQPHISKSLESLMSRGSIPFKMVFSSTPLTITYRGGKRWDRYL